MTFVLNYIIMVLIGLGKRQCLLRLHDDSMKISSSNQGVDLSHEQLKFVRKRVLNFEFKPSESLNLLLTFLTIHTMHIWPKMKKIQVREYVEKTIEPHFP